MYDGELWSVLGSSPQALSDLVKTLNEIKITDRHQIFLSSVIMTSEFPASTFTQTLRVYCSI